ncbi:MAG: hypothetical protein U1E45_23100 [Geminicoccaceae bacterium]
MRIRAIAGSITAFLAPTVATAGGTTAIDLQNLTCSAAGSVAEAAGPTPGSRGIEWRVTYDGNWALCEGPLPEAAAASGLSFMVRSDKADMLLVRVSEDSGEAFFALVPVTTAWTALRLVWRQFGPDPATPGDGVLAPDSLVSFLIGEGAGAEGAIGSRTIWLADSALD